MGARSYRNYSVGGLGPALRVVGWEEDGLQAVKVSLRDRLKLMVVTASTLNGDAQQRAHGDLQGSFQDGIPVGAHLVRIAVAFPGAVLSVTKKMGRGQRLHHRCGDVPIRPVTRHFIAGQLLTNEAVIALVLVEGSDHVVAIAVG